MSTARAEKRQQILDAAVRVFALQGFHTCRVSDIADEAGVAYGLVYHYFASKDEILDTLFSERWKVLLEVISETDATDLPARAKLRAIENQAFVLAPNQIGEHPPGHRSGGRSMIVDPWGVVLATAPDTETFVVAELDLERQQEIRRTLPSLANRRPEAYRWPSEVHA